MKYPSRVESIEEKTFSLAAPISQGTVVPLHAGALLRVETCTPDGPLVFDTEVVRLRTRGVPLLICAMPEHYDHTQRREYVRLPDSLSVALRSIGEDHGEESQRKTVELHTHDVGGGGMRVVLRWQGEEAPPETDEVLDAEIHLPPQKTKICTKARIVRMEGPDDTGRLQVGLQFVDIQERDRERLIRYLYRRQRELRQRGLL